MTNKLLKEQTPRPPAPRGTASSATAHDKDCDDLEAPIPGHDQETFLKLGETASRPRRLPISPDLRRASVSRQPQGATLTHRNVISNIQGVLKNRT